MRAIVLAFALISCGDNSVPTPPDDTQVVPDGPQVVGPLAPCLDRPTDLPLPPDGQLTCDLLPPGFSVPR